MTTIRNKGKRHIWCPEEVWESWNRMWGTPTFKRRSEIAKKIRVGEDGVAKGTHDGGSSAHAKSVQKLADYEHNIEQQEDEQTTTKLEATIEAIDEIEAFYAACGGVNRDGGVYGLGSAASHYYRDHMSHPRNARAASSSSRNVNGASSSNVNPQPDLHSIQERLDGFNAERAGFIEHLERISEHQQRFDERQQRMDQSLQSLHLSVDVDEVNEL
ncbi:uncharacterized protein [Euphorbia lathyris]|uniref:uncharacterized protein n=1 Tax=Euphorbia lathyris TaxID=212925 RepID=UPI003313452F